MPFCMSSRYHVGKNRVTGGHILSDMKYLSNRISPKHGVIFWALTTIRYAFYIKALFVYIPSMNLYCYPQIDIFIITRFFGKGFREIAICLKFVTLTKKAIVGKTPTRGLHLTLISTRITWRIKLSRNGSHYFCISNKWTVILEPWPAASIGMLALFQFKTLLCSACTYEQQQQTCWRHNHSRPWILRTSYDDSKLYFQNFLHGMVPPVVYKILHHYQHSKECFPILSRIQDRLIANSLTALLGCRLHSTQSYLDSSLSPSLMILYLVWMEYISGLKGTKCPI